MANEITSGPGDVNNMYPLLMLFPIASPKVWDGTAIQVVPTPSAELPDWAQLILTQAEKDALDSGDGMFKVLRFHATPGLSGLQMQSDVQKLYAEQEIEMAAWYAKVYRFPGKRINKA